MIPYNPHLEDIVVNSSTVLHTDLRVQVGKLNRPFSLSGTAIDDTKTPVWHEKTFKHHYVYSFRYLDDRYRGFNIYTNHLHQFIKNEIR